MRVQLFAVSVVLMQVAAPTGHATFASGQTARLEVVATEDARMRGLMFRERLAPDAGMVFVFPEAGFYPFWMKNTLIPLDMVWLDTERRVVAIARSVPPCAADPCPSYPPLAEGRPVDALYVIELAAGGARRYGIEVGQVVEMEGVPRKGT
ncbi:MAG: DUF192 domain-containing protein [Vicinamibacterales bacterium]